MFYIGSDCLIASVDKLEADVVYLEDLDPVPK